MANNPQITVEITPSLATTTDGTSTVTVLSVPFHDTTGGEAITFDVVGYDISNNDIATAKVFVRVTNTSGTLAMVGTPVHLVPIQVGSSTALQTASVNVVVSGSNVNVNVIGVAGRTIKWVAYRSPSIEVLNSWTAVTSPSDGYINSWEASNTRWNPISRAALISGLSVGGDLSGTLPNPTVIKIDGASVPAAGSLTTGNVLQVSGASALSYGPVNLAGGSNYVTGALPLGGDVTGGHSSNTVVKLQGRAVSAAAPDDGYVLAWSTGSNNWYPATGIPGPPSGAATGDLSGFYPNPSVKAITGTANNVNVACDDMTFNGGGVTTITGTGLEFFTTGTTVPIAITPGNQYRYGLLFQGSNLPNIQIGNSLSEIAWDAPSAGGSGLHDFNLYIKDMPDASTVGNDFHIKGQKGGVGGSAANGGALYLSSGEAGTSGAEGDLVLRTGTTARVTVGATAITMTGTTFILPDITTAATASSGGASLPGNPVGFIVVSIGGTSRKIPYYAT